MVWGKDADFFLKFRIPGETLIPGGGRVNGGMCEWGEEKGVGGAFRPGTGYASYLR